MASACVLSDLHEFCRRSTVDDHMDAIRAAIKAADVCVLLGDIFDFRWTKLSTIRATVQPALEWLDALMASAPHCRFVYVLGNHDAHGEFIGPLEAFADDRPQLSHHPYHWESGHSVFLHGDVAHKAMSKSKFEGKFRDDWAKDRKRGPAMNLLYDVGFTLGVHKRVHRYTFPIEIVAPRIARYLDECNLGAAAGMTDVYFGHTHVREEDYTYGNLHFHNPGATMPGIEFEPVMADIELA